MDRVFSRWGKYRANSPGLFAPILLFLAVSFAFVPFSHADEDLERAEAKAIIGDKCKSCHGFDGLAEEESWPNLNCQNRGYLYSRMLHLRSSKGHEIDDSLKGLDLSEIGKLADYYASQPCKKRY